MIRIKKSKRTPKLKVYTDKKFKVGNKKLTAAERETQAAIKHFENKTEKKIKKPKFVVYRSEDLKDLLIKIFNEKCAYCETNIRRAAKGDVEHYRPKGRIETSEGEKLKKGYYWLAADWNNLLLSCGNCNQKGRFRLNADGKKVSMGKGDAFPLSNEKKRILSRSKKLSGESRYTLLINPCKTDPAKYLVFNDEGEIMPTKSKRGTISKRGESSIQIYGLHRVELVRERKKLTMQINLLVMKIYAKIQFIEENSELPEDFKDILIDDIELDVETLNEHFEDDAEFLGAKQQKITRIVKEFPGVQTKFMNYGLDLASLSK